MEYIVTLNENGYVTGYADPGFRIPEGVNRVVNNLYEEEFRKNFSIFKSDGEKLIPDFNRKRELELASMKEEKRVELRFLREKYNSMEFEYEGNVFDGDDKSKLKFFQAANILEISEKIRWITFDNSIAELSKEDLRAIVNLLAERENKLFNHFSEKLGQLNSSNSIEEIKNICW